MNQSIKVREADYKKLKLIAAKTHRTISGTVAYLLQTSGLFKPDSGRYVGSKL